MGFAHHYFFTFWLDPKSNKKVKAAEKRAKNLIFKLK